MIKKAFSQLATVHAVTNVFAEAKFFKELNDIQK
jgi:hypothetical protein